ncbi:hypothetical protein QAD02_015544 [Eretmocerus hayati]|uniref:Uncharacterized protein n=1 Tax=Eretmocerus hayati TaxID=131215 RepID=A0ACC2P8K0_9HYME|nr:hypothetical protein QAD02_015544 [Eretmocerus hayati]
MAKRLILLSILLFYIVSEYSASAKILQLCEAAREIRRSTIGNTWINTFVCLMKSESQFDTSKVTGPGYKSSYSYGILQINSYEWCNRYRPDGFCKKKCDDFKDDNIQDDLLCAKKIFEKVGFKHWKTFERNCKDPSKLPDTSNCFKKEDDVEEYLEEEIGPDYEELVQPLDLQLKNRSIKCVEKKEKNTLISFMDILKNLKHC